MSSRQNGKSTPPSTAFWVLFVIFFPRSSRQHCSLSFPLRTLFTAFTAFHKFWCAVFSFSFFSFLVAPLTWLSYSSVLFSFQESVYFLQFLLLLKSGFISLWSDRTQCVISIVLYLLIRLASSPHAVYWSSKDFWENCQCLGECYGDNLLDPSDLTFFKSRVS